VWGEMMGSQTCRIVGKSHSVVIMIDPIIFTRTHIRGRAKKKHGWLAPSVCLHATCSCDGSVGWFTPGARRMEGALRAEELGARQGGDAASLRCGPVTRAVVDCDRMTTSSHLDR
jgi:hypothetical protein